MKCRICGDKDTIFLKKIKSTYNGKVYDFYSCNTCKNNFFNVELNDLKEMYDDLADNLTLNDDFEKSYYWANEVINIKKMHNNIKSILDVGCRTGDYLLHWSANVEKNGIELSHRSASIAKKRGLNIYEDFIENIPFKGKKFDVVSCYAVLEHLESPINVMTDLANLVDEGGVLVVLIPYFNSFKSKLLYQLGMDWHQFSCPQHLNFFTKDFLDEFYKEKGFKLQSVKYTSGGMFNPFRRIPIIRGIFGRAMNFLDFNSPLNKLPIFDHMYLYYKKTNV